jgi:hypothetical protein
MSMADQPLDGGPDAPIVAAEATHNSVLIRTREPSRETHPWVAPTLLGVAVLAGAIIWGVMATHPGGPVVNHAVGASSTSFATAPG